MNCGVLYIAFGEGYVDEAMQSAESLKEHNDVDTTLLTDSPRSSLPYFDRIKTIKGTKSPLLEAIEAMSQSPYDRTIYLDTDVQVLGDITDLFALLDEFDIAAKQKSGYYPTGPRGGQYPELPDSFPEYNTGVLVYRSGELIEEFFKDWYKEYESYIELGGNDQPAFRKALYRSDLRITSLTDQFHCRFVYPGAITHEAKTLHGRPEQVGADEYTEIADKINQTDLPRVFFPTQDELIVFYRVTDFNLQHMKQFQVPLYEHLIGVIKERCKKPIRKVYYRLREVSENFY